jgi:hypothetical protein
LHAEADELASGHAGLSALIKATSTIDMLATPDSRKAYIARALTISVATSVCAVLSALVALATLHATLPEEDAASEESLLEVLSAPMVLPIAINTAFAIAAVAYPFAFFLLVRTRLRLSIPLVLIATLAGTALGVLSHIKFCFFFGGLLTGLAAMLWCNICLRDDSPTARSERLAID